MNSKPFNIKNAFINQSIDFLMNLALVAFIFTACFLFLKHNNLVVASFFTKGFYHLINLDMQGFIFAISMVVIGWLILRNSFYLAIWLVIWVFYNAPILKFLSKLGVG